jgi:MFS family permease
MPDVTPKPLRAKANGLINIMGYMGGAFATVMGIFLKLTDYINVHDEDRKLWIIETPFMAASVLIVISTIVLYRNIKENQLAEELKDEMDLGEQLAAVESPVEDNAPMSEANRNMLVAILAAEFLWFMADNAIGTYIGNYIIYYMNSRSSATMMLTIVGGAASIVGFASGGSLADRIGRKWTISLGLALTTAAIAIACFVSPTGVVMGANGEFTFPPILFMIFVIKGFGMALVHSCSFPMVVELSPASQIGRFTGFYYTASMSAQTITPVLLGFTLNQTLAWRTLPIYGTILIVLSFTVFTVLVKNIKAVKVQNVKGLEALDGD